MCMKKKKRSFQPVDFRLHDGVKVEGGTDDMTVEDYLAFTSGMMTDNEKVDTLGIDEEFNS